MAAFNYFNCLTPLLETLGWHGDARRIFEVVPYLQESLDIETLRNVMVNLGYESKCVKVRSDHLTSDMTPGLFVVEGKVYVLHEVLEDGILITNCETNLQEKTTRSFLGTGHLYSFFPLQEEKPNQEPWLWSIFRRFHSYIYWLLALGFMTSILSTCTFVFISVVYDTVIPTRAEQTLIFMVAGVLLAVGAIEFIHVVQNRVLSYVGARVDMIIGTEVVRKVLYLPMALVEGASVAAQVSRIRQFDSIRDTFTGPLAKLLLELPFMVIFLVAMGIMGGPLVLIPLFLVLVFVVVAILMYPALRNSTSQMSYAAQERRRFLIEGASHLMAIKHLGAGQTWVNRFREVGASVALAQRHHEKLANFATNTSQSMMKIAGLACIVWGTIRVTQNLMSTGELIAIVLLVWRALSPLQAAFMMLGRADQIFDSINQVNRLMALPVERRGLTAVNIPRFEGHIKFNNVGFRYPSDTNPAVNGVMLEANPGEMVAVIGQNRSGKSTLVKLILGFYYPQAGYITIDGIDIRQFDPIGMRQAIAYVPQQNQFFHGTIAQNLRLNAPDANDEALVRVAEMAGILNEILSLPEGFDTPLNDRVISIFSSGFLQKLNLARAYIRQSNIMVMDEPGNTLDHESDEHMKNILLGMKGKKTLIVVSHRPSLINMADRVLVMQNNSMRIFGPRDKVLEIMQGNPNV